MMRRALLMLVCGVLASLTAIVYWDGGDLAGKPVYEYYLQSFIQDTGAMNAVTAIYLNYRVFDTLFEALLLLLSVIAVIYLSWRNDDEI